MKKTILMLSAVLMLASNLWAGSYESQSGVEYKVWRFRIRDNHPGEIDVRFYGDGTYYLIRESDFGGAQFDKIYTLLLQAQAKGLNCYFGGQDNATDCTGVERKSIKWINVNPVN